MKRLSVDKNIKNTKILIIVPKQSSSKKVCYSYLFPLGLGYISSTLKKEGYDVDCLNLNHYNGTIQELVNKVLNKKNYDFVCTGSIATEFNRIKTIIDTIKNHRSRPKSILGGLIITSEPETVFNLLNPDIAIIGEGEEVILELLDHIKKGKDLRKIRGLVFRDKHGKLVLTERRESIKEIDSLPYPDYEGFEFEKFLDNQHPNFHDYIYSAFDHPRVYSIMGSRGCPFKCTFCYHYSLYRKRSIDNIMKELKVNVKKYKINAIHFYDECISLDRKRLYKLCEEIKKLRGELPWELKWYIQLTIHNVDEELLTRIKEAGVAGVSYGFESFSPVVLKSMNKPITPQMIESVFHKTMKAGLTIQANFIFGDVAETKETAKETLDWWKKNANGQIWLLFIQPYPGSQLYKHCLEKGIIKDKNDFIKNVVPFNKYNMTNKMTDKEISQLRREILDVTRKYCKFVSPVSIKKTRKNIYNLKVKCPYCKKMITYGNCLIDNKWNYSFNLPCRECGLRFYIVSFIRKIGYKHYPYFRALRDYQKSIFRKLKL
jgi:radical SAM superfamily enzyme YgiQ (UPF0313 family)